MNRIITALATVATAALLTGCGGIGDAPDVRGYSLPDAKRQLKTQNYSASVTSDGLLGVLVEENWTVCKQKAPKGRMVKLEVSKDC